MGAVRFCGVEEYDVRDSHFRLLCSVEAIGEDSKSSFDEAVPLIFTFYSESVLNIFFSPSKSRMDYESVLELDYDSIRSPVELSENVDEGTLAVSNGTLTVTIDLESAAFCVTAENELLRSPESLTDLRGRFLAKPLGFSEQEVQNWPLEVVSTHGSFRLHPDENIYGCGERFGQVEHTGEQFTARVEQANGTMSDATYKSVPFYLSDRGYGVLVETTTDVHYDFGASAVNTVEVTVHDDVFSSTIFYGPSPKEILRKYTAVTGRPPRLPKWTFGLWMSRNSYKSAKEVTEVASRLRELSIPCDVIHIDPEWMADDEAFTFDWDECSFNSLESFADELHDQGFKLSLWEYPCLKRGSDLFEEADANGYLVTDKRDDPYVLRRPSSTTLPFTQFGIIDFTDEEAREWWKEYHRRLISKGVDAFKLDFAEYLPSECNTSSGWSGQTLHNFYPTLYADTVSRAFDELKTPPVLWTRAGWAGTQAFPVHWGGDPFCTFESFAATVRGGLSLSLSGYPFWSCDAGGYDGKPDRVLYIRWLQWCLLGLSHVRLHGETPREPWEFGEVAVEVARKYTRERYRLLPYIYSYAEQAHQKGLPLMRHLWLEFPDSPAVKHQETQHLLGESLLVAPVLDRSGDIKIVFPEGEWIDYWTGEYIHGPTTLSRSVELTELPLFVRGGSIIPVQNPSECVDHGTPKELVFEVYPNRETRTKATFPFYHEDSSETVSVEVAITESHARVNINVSDLALLRGDTIRLCEPKMTPDVIRINDDPIADAEVTEQGDDVEVTLPDIG